MANTCECGVAIALGDIKKLKGAIGRTVEPEGMEEMFQFDITKGDERHTVKHYTKYAYMGGDSQNIKFYEVDGKKMDEEKFRELYPMYEGDDRWLCDYETHRCLIDRTINNGWYVDWQKMNSYSYEIPPQIEEYDDHLTIFFGGRWCFPETLENFLNECDVEWQGAEAEPGCEVFNDDLGNSDFNLRWTREKVEGETYYDYYVEDTSKR